MSTVYLSDDQLALLTDDELELYEALLEAEAAEWVLTPRQQMAEDLAAKVDVLFYGGAAGGGKTDWLMWHVWNLSTMHRGHSTLALRRTFPQLKDSLMRRSIEKFDQARAKYLVGEKEWIFDNNSTVRFGYCDAEDDYRHYLSAEYDCIIFEELTEFSELQFKMLRSRCRTTAAKRRRGIRPHVAAASNPGQIGHEWVKTTLVQPTNYGHDIAQVEIEAMGRKKLLSVGFVPAKVTDNPHIDPDYIFNLASLPEIQRRQYLDGDWDIFEGQYFSEWDAATHVVEPFGIPETWTRIRCVDYGFAAPFACLWLAFDPDGNCWVYREAYQKGLTATEQAKLVVAMSTMPPGEDGKRLPEKIDYTVADPSVWARGGTGMSIASQYHQAGMHARKAMNARIDGWTRLRDWLRASPLTELSDGRRNPHFGPTLRVFSTCTNLIRTLPLMIHSDTNPEDLDTTLEDHAVDALRYGLMSRPRRARDPELTVGTLEEREWARLRALDGKRKRQPAHPVLGRL